jgi:excisionase family DNA binding protein
MATPTIQSGSALPSLQGLFVHLKATFVQHVEVADLPASRVLRVAGLELPLPPQAGESQVLLETVCERLAEVAAFGLSAALTEASAHGTRQRMELVSALAQLEATAGSLPAEQPTRRMDASGELLTTAEVATQLGMSRPYVSMLCDQGKLGEITRSEGGHRRISRQAVEDYRRTHVHAPTPAA